MLKYAFSIEYGGGLPDIKKTPNGKPYFPERRDIHFSLSHSRTHVICALSANPVGIDIESPRIISERAIKFFCSPEEQVLFDPLDLWVLKESYIKLVGGTLPMIKKLRFSKGSDTIQASDKDVISRLYRIGDCSANACRAAVCSIGGVPPDSIELITSSID